MSQPPIPIVSSVAKASAAQIGRKMAVAIERDG